MRLDRMRLPLDPPFRAAWDPVPRRRFDATLVRVETDEGLTGYGSGDTMDGLDAFEDLFVGRDPLQIAGHVAAIETINFHAGRYWRRKILAAGHARLADLGITGPDFDQIAADALDDEVLANTPHRPAAADIHAILQAARQLSRRLPALLPVGGSGYRMPLLPRAAAPGG